MKNTLNKILKTVWLLSGVSFCVVMVMIMTILLDVKMAATDVKELWGEVTIHDLRSAINLFEKEIDAEILRLQIQEYRVSNPIPFTEANWSDFLAFCGETGYVPSDYTWQLYRYGRLTP